MLHTGIDIGGEQRPEPGRWPAWADHRFVTLARSTLATIHMRLGDSEGGLAEHARAREAATEQGDLVAQAHLLADLAESLVRLDRRPEALLTAQDTLVAAGRLRLPVLSRRAHHVLHALAES